MAVSQLSEQNKWDCPWPWGSNPVTATNCLCNSE